MVASENEIPSIDFAPFLNKHHGETAAAISCALERFGCVRLENYGISQEEVETVMEHSKQFFALPLETKMNSARPLGTEPGSGYLTGQAERPAPVRDGHLVTSVFSGRQDAAQYVTVSLCSGRASAKEVREGFDLIASSVPQATAPESEQLVATLQRFYSSCRTLTFAVLEAISLGLRLPAHRGLSQLHAHIGDLSRNSTLLRSSFYPAFSKEDYDMKSTRLMAHTDFGTISFIFQDDIGGLEANLQTGQFVPVKPEEGTVLLIVADVLALWTGGAVRALNHRVVIPDEATGKKDRQSIIYFVDPDYDSPVFDLRKDKPEKTIRAKDVVRLRYEQAFVNNK